MALLRSPRQHPTGPDQGDFELPEDDVQPVSQADWAAVRWLRENGIDPRDYTPAQRELLHRQYGGSGRDVPGTSLPGIDNPVPYRPAGGPLPPPTGLPHYHDSQGRSLVGPGMLNTPEWYDREYGHWGGLIQELEMQTEQDWSPYRRLEAAQRLEALGPDLVEQYGPGYDPTAGIEAGDYTGERDTRAPAAVHDPAIDGPFAGLADALRQGQADAGAYAGLDEAGRLVMDSIFPPTTDPSRPSDAMPLPFLEPRTDEERAAQQAMAADRARQAGGGRTPPSAARRWGITPPPLHMTTSAAEMPGPNTAASGTFGDQWSRGGWDKESTGTTGGFAGKNWYLGNQGASSNVATPEPEGPTPMSKLQSQKGREGPKKSPADVRFPIQNVLDATGMGLRELARQVGAAPSQLRDPKGLTVDVADRVAVALGAHPIDFWPDFHAGIDTTDVQPQSTNAAERRIAPANTAMSMAPGVPDPPGGPIRPPSDPWGMLLDQLGIARNPAERLQPLDRGTDPSIPLNTAMSSSMPYEGDRPPFPPEWDVNNPEDRQAHFENVYKSLLDNLVGTFGGAQNPAGGAVPVEDLPRVGPGSAYSQGRNVVRPGDLGLPSFWDHPDAGELGAGELRTQWLKAHPEYQVAQDFTDPTDYPVDIPAEGQAGDAATRGGHFFGGDEYDRYWAGPQAGVSKNDQARLTNGGGTNRKPELPGPNTAMGRTLPTGDSDMRPWWLRLVDQVSGGPGMHGPDVNFPPLGSSPSGNVTPLYDWENPPPDVPGPNTAMSTTTPDDGEPIDPRIGHPSGGGGGLPPGYERYVPGGEQPDPTTHIPLHGVWDYGDQPLSVPVDPGYDDRFVESLHQHDQYSEWLDAAAEAQRNNQPLPPMPGGGMGDLAGGFGLSAMGGGAAVPRRVGGYGSQFRPRALGGYQPARPLAPLGGFGFRQQLPPMGGFGSRGAGVPSSTSMNPAVRSFQSGPRHEPFDGLLENLQRNSGKIAVGTAIGLGAIASGVGRLFSPFGG